MALAVLGLGCFRANLPVIIVHDKPSLAKQSQALDEHLEFEVQENPNQGNTWEGFSPEKDIALPAPRETLTKACPFPPEARSESSLIFCIIFLWLLLQMSTNLVTRNNIHLSSYSSSYRSEV